MQKETMKKVILLSVMLAAVCVQARAQQASAEKVGYASLPYIMSKLPEVQKIQAQMKTSETQFRDQIKEKSDKLQQQYKAFNENAPNMVDTVRQNKQQELNQAMADLEKFQQDANQALANQEKLYMAPIYLKVNRAIAEVARENGFAIILSKEVSSYPLLLFQEPASNVSDLVLKKFGVTVSQK